MPDGTCSVAGCERPQKCRRLCQLHYGRLHRTGNVGGPGRVIKGREGKSPRPCSMDGCEQSEWLRGLCRMHYDRQRLTGSVGTAGRLRGVRGEGRRPVPCSVQGCDRLAVGRGLCNLHHLRWCRTGEPGPAEFLPKRKAAPRGLCKVDGCTRSFRYPSSQLCSRHHDRWKWSGDPGPAKIRTPLPAGGPCMHAQCEGRAEMRGLCGPHYFSAYHDANRGRRDEQVRKWREDNADRARINGQAASRRRRARLRNLPTERYTLQDIIARDGLDCVLCGGELELAADWLHPRSVTVEHLECVSWPDSAGDVLANVAAAHRKCNRDRGNKPHPAADRKRTELLAVQATHA